jgi:hypothetical protein
MRPVNSSMMTTSPFLDDVVLVALEQLVRAQRLLTWWTSETFSMS